MNLENLSLSFSRMENELQLPQYIREICSGIITKSITRQLIDDVLIAQNINYSIAKIDFLHVIFHYIKISLEDGIFNEDEKKDIRFLKTIFKIKTGDFIFHNKSEIENVINYQLNKIYEDDKVNDIEALFKVDLQEIFDLSFDQMNELSKPSAINALRRGADSQDLDIFLLNSEYFKFKQ